MTFSKKDKGALGEAIIRSIVQNTNGYYRHLSNLYAIKPNGEYAEIDIVFIHETGIYVIESKNYSGWIFGEESSRQWCQTFANGRKNFFYNPIMQNRKHIAAIQKHLGNVSSQLIYSWIVFGDDCEIKKAEVESPHIKVLHHHALKPALNEALYNNQVKLTPTDIDALYEALKPLTNASIEVKELHRKQVDKYKKKNTEEGNSESKQIQTRQTSKSASKAAEKKQAKQKQALTKLITLIIMLILFYLFYHAFLANLNSVTNP